jgi:hypothetical protein
MKIITYLFLLLFFIISANDKVVGQTTPDKIKFIRQGVRRIIFDKSQRIPLVYFNPAKVVGLDIMHPPVGEQKNNPKLSIEKGALFISADKPATVTRWLGGFNAFATYDLVINKFSGSGENGLLFKDPQSESYISVHLVAKQGEHQAVSCIIGKEGQEVEKFDFVVPVKLIDESPVTLRVQMLAVGANVYLEQHEQTTLIGRFDFVKHFDLRKKDLMRSFEFCLDAKLAAGASIEIVEASAYISPGMGQADLRMVTYEDGSPYFYNEKLWILITVRGGGLPHPMQGVYSLNPSVFDIQFEGIILYDRGDGLFRNELASNIFYDREAKEWRGFTTGFSSYGDPDKKERKEILAVSSSKMPLQGISIMKAKSIGLIANYEDPQCIYDAEVGKWRMLLCEAHDGYKAVLRESDTWDGDYKVIAGPISINSTGTQLQKIGGKYYVFFGSSQRKIFIYSYPGLKLFGEVDVQRPPWDDKINTRIWPNIIALPEGYPSPYIALMMDRNNFPGMKGANWTYGALYLYHGYD